MAQVIVQIALPITVIKKRKWYVACCPTLDVHAQGDDKEKAIESLKETLELFLASCYERGVLDEVLKESGFSVNSEATKTPKRIRVPKENYVNIPLYLLSNNPSTLQCHA